jgi:DNA-binding PadR family transcriptional regulator
MQSGSMHKELHILGLLQSGPRTGYELHRIVVAHGELFTDLKKGNVYYLLERLAETGALQVTAEAGARGPRRERLIYALADQGRQRFQELLREVVRTYEPTHTGIEVGMIFLSSLDPHDAIHLLEERRQTVLARRTLLEREAGTADHPHEQLARDHLVSLMEAELGWVERALQRLRQRQEKTAAPPTSIAARCPGMQADDQA